VSLGRWEKETQLSVVERAIGGCVQCKKELVANLNSFLAPIREKRQALERNMAYVRDVLNTGIKRGLETSEAVWAAALRAMKIDYRDILS
jgi:tryptophanyl-tRNA synthetase